MTLICAGELAEDIVHFVAFKRAMGHSYQRSELTLKSFQRAVEHRAGLQAKVPFDAVPHEWLSRNPHRQPVSVGLEFGVIRQLCLYRRRRDPASFLPEQDWAPIKESTFLPYIFTHEQVVHLITAASAHDARHLSAGMLRMLLLILYCTGLRLGEAARLQLSDIDLEQQGFFVRESKGRSRIVPFLDDLAHEIDDCLRLRRRILDATASADPGTLLLRNSGQALPVKGASEAIRRLLRREGLKPDRGRTGPRPYEFRRAFAVHRLTAWYHEGVDVHARLPKDPLLAYVESFFRDYLQRLRGASAHTVRAYRDTLRLLFIYLADTRESTVANLQLSDLHVEAVAAFLAQLESDRANSITTRNCRRAAIRSFCKHLIRVHLPHAEQYQKILALPAKKCQQTLASYLEAAEVRAILDQPDCRTVLGQRDYGLLLFLYNTGARISEALSVCCADLHLTTPRQVRLHGKGKKDRLCPLWRDTTEALLRLPTVRDGAPGAFVFLNRQGQPLTRDGAAYLLQKYVIAAIPTAPTLQRRTITPHVLRHSCAVALLQSGVDVTVIRDYLGHASIATTSRYLTTNLQMKREALEAFWQRAGIEPTNATPWQPSAALLAFLASL